ncbi:hypothetical protein AMATHDRAFT_71735 [Amanita thiersii Skay4041]|uniref:DUF6534 domain-containing protein n=1 Tax=Amanita thiersii Skay4041 TaxID=703135 RepID=A0A2A9NCQ4_9AGAR|nr:hypothetical protein AMATHDRAFT_71735 [Amanita thiersii Skay4041]
MVSLQSKFVRPYPQRRRQKERDRVWNKVTVYTIYGLESIHTICLAYELIVVVGLNKPAVPILGGVFITGLLGPLILGLVGLISQCLYAHRILVITQSRITPIIICLLAVSQFIGALIFAISLTTTGSSLSFVFGVESSSSGVVLVLITSGFIWLISSAVCDILIAVVMVYSLSRRKLLSKEIQTHVTRLIRLVLETGSLTAFINIALVVFLVTPMSAGPGAAPTIALSKIYANSVMVLLNNRLSIVGGRNASTSATEEESGISISGNQPIFRHADSEWSVASGALSSRTYGDDPLVASPSSTIGAGKSILASRHSPEPKSPSTSFAIKSVPEG